MPKAREWTDAEILTIRKAAREGLSAWAVMELVPTHSDRGTFRARAKKLGIQFLGNTRSRRSAVAKA